jgi:hypothetical protein
LFRPLRQTDSIGRDVRAGIAGVKQTPQFLLRVGFGSVNSLREPPAVYAIAQPPRILASHIDPALAKSAPSAHFSHPGFFPR